MKFELRILARLTMTIGMFLPLMSPPIVAAETVADCVLIHMRSEVETLQPVVRISAVANVSGGNERLRQQIAGLDIAELMDDVNEDEISSTRILARLALAGIPADAYQIEGADVTRVSRADPGAGEELILETCRRSVSDRFNVAADDVRVRLRSPLSGRLVELLQDPKVTHFDLELPPVVRLGATSVTLRLMGTDGLQATWPLAVDVALRQPVLVAARPLPGGSTVSASDVSMEVRFLSEPVELLNDDEVTGRSTRGPLYPGEIITDRNLATPRPRRVEPLVRPRDNVRLIARSGAVVVTASTAEVLQAGAEGELVRVRNSDSGNVVVGRVINAELIEIPLGRVTLFPQD